MAQSNRNLTNRRPFEGDYPGTAEEYLLTHLKLREKVFIGLVLAVAMCGCAHEQAPTAPLEHDAAGCMTVCPQATYVEMSPKGDLCRCWAPGAFTYTFLYPSDTKLRDEQRAHWLQGKAAVAACTAKGQAWEPSEDKQSIVCMAPSEPEPPAADPLRHTNSLPFHSKKPKWIRAEPTLQWKFKKASA